VIAGGRVSPPASGTELPETALFEKGRELYGLPQAGDAIRASSRHRRRYMDVVALAQHGIEYAVATPGYGQRDPFAKLFRLTDDVVFCFDGDAGVATRPGTLEVALPALAIPRQYGSCFAGRARSDSFVRSQARNVRVADRQRGRFRRSCWRAARARRHRHRRRALAPIAEAKPLLKIAAPALQLQLLRQFSSGWHVARGRRAADRDRTAPQPANSAPAPGAPRPVQEQRCSSC
jgi:DNA primase